MNFLLAMSVISSVFFAFPVVHSDPACVKSGNMCAAFNLTEVGILLAFKNSVVDPLGQLSDWSLAKTCQQGWTGVCTNRDGSINQIILKPGKIAGKIPWSFGNLPSLVTLILASNIFTGSIPSSLGNLPVLQYFDFSNNYFTNSIPASLLTLYTCESYSSLTLNCLSLPPGDNSGCTLRPQKPRSTCLLFTSKLPNIISDIAYKKRAVQSSTKGFSASLAVDGITGMGFMESTSCTHTLPSTNPFWYVDLGATYALTTIRLYNRLDCCSDRLNSVQVWTGSSERGFNASGNSNCNVPNFVYKKTQNNGFPITVNCKKKGRYVWVVLRGSNRILSLCEVTVSGILA